MLQAKLFFLFFLIATISCSELLIAETVKLKNGTVLHGSIVQMTESELTIDTADMGQIQVKRRAIQGFEDDSTPVAAPTLPPSLVASAPAAAPVGISINNNNNNTNTATSSSSSSAAATAAPPAVVPVPEQTVARPAPEPTDKQSLGFVFGSLGAGVSYIRTKGNDEGESSDLGNATWSRAMPTLHWDLLGYRWDGGFSLTAFVQGTRKDEYGATSRDWYQGGLRADYAFGQHQTRYGSGAVYLGLGVGQMTMTTKEKQTDSDYGYYSSYPWPSTRILEIERKGQGGTAKLAYQVLGSSGLGLDLGLSLSQGALKTSKVHGGELCPRQGTYDYYGNRVVACTSDKIVYQTLGMTAGLAYAF